MVYGLLIHSPCSSTDEPPSFDNSYYHTFSSSPLFLRTYLLLTVTLFSSFPLCIVRHFSLSTRDPTHTVVINNHKSPAHLLSALTIESYSSGASDCSDCGLE